MGETIARSLTTEYRAYHRARERLVWYGLPDSKKTMTKKHYEAIARILLQREAFEEDGKSIAEALADYFEQDNPRFQRDRFLQACGIESKGARLYR